MIAALAGRFRGIFDRLRDALSTLSLSQIFHMSFLMLLAAQLFIVISFLRYGFDQYAEPNRKNLERRAQSIVATLQDPDIGLLLRDAAAIPAKRPLRPVLIREPLNLALPERADWDQLRTCRRTFQLGRLKPIDVCIAMLEANPRWGEDFRQTGKFVYVTIGFDAGTMAIHDRGNMDIGQTDSLTLTFDYGRHSDEIVVLNEMMRRKSGEGEVAIGSPFLRDPRTGSLTSLKGPACQIRRPAARPGRSIYLCQFSFKAVPIFSRLRHWPPNALERRKLRSRVEVMKFEPRLGRAVRLAATFDGRPGHVRDTIGKSVASLDVMLSSSIDDQVEVCILGPGGRLVWKNPPADCGVSAPNDAGRVRPIDQACDIWCALSGLVFFGSGDRPVEIKIPDSQGYSVLAHYNEREAAEVWLRGNAKRAIFLLLLMAATLIVYLIVFRKVLQPIRGLSIDVERATVDLSKRVVLAYPTSGDEIASLVRSFNALLARVTDVVDAEVNNLKMIGHDIRSPLQSLLALIPPDDEGYRQVKRIYNAIERFDASSGPREAFEQASIAPKAEDVALFLGTIAKNAKKYGTFDDLVYSGPTQFVWIDVDTALLEDVVGHILDNGNRYRPAGSPITITLAQADGRAVIDIDNLGPHLADNMLTEIFEYGVTTQAPDGPSLGQGLYAAKSFVTRMGGTIEAINLAIGVRFRLTFPVSAAE